MNIKNFGYPIISYETIGDGSCFIHAVLGCFCKPYISGSVKVKRDLVIQFRKDLSESLDMKKNKKTFYENLSRGEIEELSQHIPSLKKEAMKKYLESNNWLTQEYIELISEILNINIYIVDENKNNFYILGDNDIYYKKRNSVIIKYIDQYHYETCGLVVKKDYIQTFFKYNSDVIKKINNRIKHKDNTDK